MHRRNYGCKIERLSPWEDHTRQSFRKIDFIKQPSANPELIRKALAALRPFLRNLSELMAPKDAG
jgi:hypothetical protein